MQDCMRHIGPQLFAQLAMHPHGIAQQQVARQLLWMGGGKRAPGSSWIRFPIVRISQKVLLGTARLSVRFRTYLMVATGDHTGSSKRGLGSLGAGTHGRPSESWRGIMKALITALALVTLISAPSFAQRGDFEQHYNNSSPASPDYGSNGY
jgi:hypothetical protein